MLDPNANSLGSWREGSIKSAIFEFVRAVVTEGSSDYVAPADRVATFDNDGTLWVESPLYVEGYFLLDRVAELVRIDPALAKEPALAAVLARDMAALHRLGKRGIIELVMRTHTGMTTDEFDRIAHGWFERAIHPRWRRPFRECVYQPMLELIACLESHGFSVYMVTGGGADFARVISESAYGISRAHVIGSRSALSLLRRDGLIALSKLPELVSFDDRDEKPRNIHAHIGRRPILAFGNSDGDLAMLEYATGAAGRRAAFLLHHDDAERESAYDGDFQLSPLIRGLEEAKARSWNIVSMKRDFARVFSWE
jgi:hypothetical protein